jgi:hypothetical protein
MAKLFVCLAVCMFLGSSICEMTAEQTQFFGAAVTSASQLVVEQEMQRRFADIFIGFQQANSFRSMAMAKLASTRITHGAQQGSGYPAFLELKTEESKEKDLEMFPFMMGGGGYGQGQGFQTAADAERAETTSKIAALKYLFMQVLTTSSDVQQQYWINKAISTLVPQFATIKLYKTYLSTFALSSAIQLHDVYTFEAYIDDFNDNHPQGGQSSQLTESVAELNLFRSWQSLVYMRFALFYMGMYEKSMAASVPVTPAAPATPPTSFLEEESTAEPTQQDPQAMMVMQYTYMSYYVYILKFYALFTEMSIPQYGLMMASTKVRAQQILTDDDKNNDAQGVALRKQADYIDGYGLPMAISQWSNIVFMRYYFEYFLMMFDMSFPQLSQARQLQRIDDAMLNLNLAQVDKK